MGYGQYDYNGKLCGYMVADVCNEDGCDTSIDRGLAYACGGYPGEHDDFCDGYFCAEHLFFPDPDLTDSSQLCRRCLADLGVGVRDV